LANVFHHFPTIAWSAALGAVVFETTQAKPAQLETEAAGNGIEQGWWDHDRRFDRLEGKVEELRETAPANAAETNAVPAGNALESTNAPTGSGQSAFEQFQRETESRERALSLEKNRLIKERVEQVLRNGRFRQSYIQRRRLCAIVKQR